MMQLPQQHPGWGIGVVASAGARYAAMVCFVAVCVVHSGSMAIASEPTETAVSGPPEVVAPNQSIKLTAQTDVVPAEPDRDSPNTAQALATDTDQAATIPVSRGDSAIDEQAQPRRSGARIVRPRIRSDAGEPALGRAQQPWYRTGLGALAIVLALVGVVFVLARRWIPTMRMADNAALQVIARTGVTPRHSVVLIRLGQRLVLVGVAGDRIQRLGEVTDPAEVAEITACSVGGGGSAGVFDKMLLQESSAFGAGGEPDSPTPEVASAMERRERRRVPGLANLKSRLKALRSH